MIRKDGLWVKRYISVMTEIIKRFSSSSNLSDSIFSGMCYPEAGAEGGVCFPIPFATCALGTHKTAY